MAHTRIYRRNKLLGIGCFSVLASYLITIGSPLVRSAFPVLVFFLILILYVFISKLTKPLKETLDITNTIAGGNLAIDINVTSNDEIGQLMESVEIMKNKLLEVVSQVQRSSIELSDGSVQLSSATQQLSQGTTVQAASTEEVSSSMEEMASNIQQTAENAGETEHTEKQK